MYGFDGEQTDVTGMIYLRARYYAPYLNRFTSRDPWAGDYKQPMSYNGWMFGYGNPVRYTDPSGMVPCSMLPPEDQVNCVNGTGKGMVNVNLSSSIVKDKYEAQYINYENGRIFYDGSNSTKYHNLCGQISLEMIYETITGSTNTLPTFIEASGKRKDGTYYFDLQAYVEKVFPTGWEARGYYGKTVTRRISGQTHLQKLSLLKNWWIDKDRKNNMSGVLFNMLSRGHYIIASVVLDLNNGLLSTHTIDNERYVKHWVVLSGIDGGLVRVNNPFSNRVEWLTWGEFNQTIVNGYYTILDIHPWTGLNEDIIGDLKEYGLCPSKSW